MLMLNECSTSSWIADYCGYAASKKTSAAKLHTRHYDMFLAGRHRSGGRRFCLRKTNLAQPVQGAAGRAGFQELRVGDL